METRGRLKPPYLLWTGASGSKIVKQPKVGVGVKILYEDKDILVLDKPAGLVVHPSPSHKSDTLVDILLDYYPKIKNIGEDVSRPGIVHRLDKETSGVLVVAKANQAFQYLKKQFRGRKIIKKYLALVVGGPPQDKSTISTYLARDKKDKTKQKVLALPLAKGKIRQAITAYRVIKKYRGYTLLELQPKTGRLHQIRAHLKWLGCPVAGDKKYKRKRRPCPEGLKRQFLHAFSLRLQLPNGQVKEFRSPLPPGLRNVLQGLEKNQKK